MKLEYRLLENEEKKKLFEVFPQYSGLPLDSFIMGGAVDENDKVRAFVVLHYVPHCEPMWIDSGLPIDFRRLVRLVEEKVERELWVFAPNEHISRMAEICGAQDTGWKVMRKEL